ncbi:uncharacterized protein [Euwallacea fornicatus]|uniref:uncharacterized protein n=1 Tax=Euwallacea fornicatus TaxID=995702 RepID=UPI00338D4481
MNISIFDDLEEVSPISPPQDLMLYLDEIAENTSSSTYYFNCFVFFSGIFSIFVCCINSALICYTVFKFRALRTRTNYLLVNFFIVSSLFSVIYGIETCIISIAMRYYFLIYFLALMEPVLLNITWFIMMLLALDWYSSAHWHGTFIKFTKYYKLILGFLYLVSFVVFILIHVINVHKFIIFYIFVINYLTILITIIAWNIMRLRRTYTTEMMKTYYAFASATLYILICSPVVFFMLINNIVNEFSYRSDWTQIFDNIMFWVISISMYITILSPVLIAFLLTRWDSQFKLGFGQVLMMKFARNNNLEGYTPYVNYTSGECIEEDVKLS